MRFRLLHHARAPQNTFQFTQLPLILGRSTEANIHIDDPWASRQHCEIFLDGNQPKLRDLDAKHGTFVNGQRVTVKSLDAGDEIQIGLAKVLVESVESLEKREQSFDLTV